MYKFLTWVIALVWLMNGLGCKILNWVPRHQEIVAQILGEAHARTFVVLIGMGEIVLALLILSRFQPRILAVLQILLVVTMNILEFILVPELLLWGKLNALFALGFVLLVYYHEFVLRKPKGTM